MKKQLKTKKRKSLNIKTNKEKTMNIFEEVKNLHYSGFCLTDNVSCALFYVDDKFIVDNELPKCKINFTLTEDDLNMEFDRSSEISNVEKHKDHVTIKDVGNITIAQHDFFTKKYPKCAFYQLTSFFGQKVKSFVLILENSVGKPVGILKTY